MNAKRLIPAIKKAALWLVADLMHFLTVVMVSGAGLLIVAMVWDVTVNAPEQRRLAEEAYALCIADGFKSYQCAAWVRQ